MKRSGKVWAWVCLLLLWFATGSAASEDLARTVKVFSAYGDRSTGSDGQRQAADYIEQQFESMGFDTIGRHKFDLPILRHKGSLLGLPREDLTVPLQPLHSNAVTPQTIVKNGLKGPIVYVGHGALPQFNGKTIAGAVVLMELDSGKNWLHAVNLGAQALIYVDRGHLGRSHYEDKLELTPFNFPRFWLPLKRARRLFGDFEKAPQGVVNPHAVVTSRMLWESQSAENMYCLVPGRDEKLTEELVIVEAFYDSTALVAGKSPGAEEALGVATLLQLGRFLKDNPPKRSILLVATAGHAQTLAGMREMIWSIRYRTGNLRDMKKFLVAGADRAQETLQALESWDGQAGGFDLALDSELNQRIAKAIGDQIKSEVDDIARLLMTLRMEQETEQTQALIKRYAQERLFLRRLGWRTDYAELTKEESEALKRLVPKAMDKQRAILTDTSRQLENLKSTRAFRSVVKDHDLTAVVSLHLSSQGDGIGAFNQGWLHNLKPIINRVSAWSTLEQALNSAAVTAANNTGSANMFHDTLRPSRRRSWQSYFVDTPRLGCEISSLGGYLGISLATVNDGRPLWGTPRDLAQTIDWNYAHRQAQFVCAMIKAVAGAPALINDESVRNGFSTVIGRANFLRHGELFADQPAPGSIIMAFQGLHRYFARVDHLGRFYFKGIADKKHVLDKLIIESYKFDPESGKVVWAVDKKQTGKPAYRLKMLRTNMQTDLVMFACRQTTMFNLLEPRNFHYLTKIKLIDGRREALPLRHWWSRIDTRDSTALSVFLEPGTRLKMILSDSVIAKKLILTNGSDENPLGDGYKVDDWPLLYRTEHKVARDMWTLLAPRIDNLESHGIFNERIRTLQQEGQAALAAADEALTGRRYDHFFEMASKSWALANRVYTHVEKTQKDVLFGVLFYIALFVPFAFCMERLLFSYVNIYRRIIAFSAILLLLIVVIYNVHPAFNLAYSPTVVILAFFIIGLSFLVSLIIFFRFEEEMGRLQNRARSVTTGELGRWKAFVAAFLLGVSNLRRRRLRTFLTCTTLIILTFTIMSFTSVKSMRHHTRILYQPTAPYGGFLLKNFNWYDLPREAYNIIANAFGKDGVVVPRVWFEAEDKTRATRIPIRGPAGDYEAQGLVGLSVPEARVSGLDQLLIGGRWFLDKEERVIMLPERMARELGINPHRPQGQQVRLWGMIFDVVAVFSGKRFQEYRDLDGESLTPVIFPHETVVEMTEVEADALESGDDIKAFQSRYQHLPGDLTVVVPYQTLLALGGKLKSVAIEPLNKDATVATANTLVDRFGLTLFSGEPEGTYLYNASDTLSYSGVPNIIIPLVISVLIVLNTMISSVFERKREIGVYTSVGLAPSHVSFLFIAEALAFAVISVVLGYLLAQTSARVFSGTWLWAGITVNYSSLAGVAAMVLVIVVVLISVIYPSRVAGQIAIPDVNRSWTLPEAEDNVMNVTLPFLMKHAEHRSAGGYLYDYFKGHEDVTHGVFSADKVRWISVTPEQNPALTAEPEQTEPPAAADACLHLSARIWLAPFDFGIMQTTDVWFYPSAEEPGFLEIQVRLLRESGEANAWHRINKIFLNAIRRQLLVWRSLDNATQAHYAGLLADAPASTNSSTGGDNGNVAN